MGDSEIHSIHGNFKIPLIRENDRNRLDCCEAEEDQELSKNAIVRVHDEQDHSKDEHLEIV